MKMRVDLLLCDPATLEWRRLPSWEWDGQKVKELSKWAENFREVTWCETYTPEDGMPFLEALHKGIVGTFVAATEPYEVEED